MLDLTIPNPYPPYRDIGLAEPGIACLAVSDTVWTRTRLQSILKTALNQEGFTFTYDLPAVLLEEGQRRELPDPGLAGFLQAALNSSNHWGTAMRAHSARAAALHWQGKPGEAFATQQEAGCQDVGFSGYGVLSLLALANRCIEVGMSEKITETMWGRNHDMGLLNGAKQLSLRDRDEQLRKKRIELVENFESWYATGTPSADEALTTLSQIPNADTRRVYKEYVTTRWASVRNVIELQ